MKRELVSFNKFNGGVNYDSLNQLGIKDDELLIADNIEPDLRGGFTLRKGTKNVNKYSYEGNITQLIDFNQKDGTTMEMAIIDKVLYDIKKGGSIYQSRKKKICDVANDTIGYVVYKNRFYFVDGENYRVMGDYQYTTQFLETSVKKGDIVLNSPLSKGVNPGIINNFYRALEVMEMQDLSKANFGDSSKWENVTHIDYPSIPDVIRNIDTNVTNEEIIELLESSFNLYNTTTYKDWFTLAMGDIEPTYPVQRVKDDAFFGYYEVDPTKIREQNIGNSWFFNLKTSNVMNKYSSSFEIGAENMNNPLMKKPFFVANTKNNNNRNYLYLDKTYLNGAIGPMEKYNNKELEFFLVADVESDGCLFALAIQDSPNRDSSPLLTVYKKGTSITVSARSKHYESMTIKTAELKNPTGTFILNLSVNFYEGHFSLNINGIKTDIYRAKMTSKGLLDLKISGSPPLVTTYSIFASFSKYMNQSGSFYKDAVTGKFFSFAFFDRQLMEEERESFNYYLRKRFLDSTVEENPVLKIADFGNFEASKSRLADYGSHGWEFIISEPILPDFKYTLRQFALDGDFYKNATRPTKVFRTVGGKDRTHLYLENSFMQHFITGYGNYNKREMEFFLTAETNRDGCIFSLLSHNINVADIEPMITIYKEGNKLTVNAKAKYGGTLTSKSIVSNELSGIFILNFSINFVEGHFSLYINGEKTNIYKSEMLSKGTLDVKNESQSSLNESRKCYLLASTVFAYTNPPIQRSNAFFKDSVQGKIYHYSSFDRELKDSERRSIFNYMFDRYISDEDIISSYKEKGSIITKSPIILDVSKIDPTKTFISWTEEIPKETNITAYFVSSDDENYRPKDSDWSVIKNNYQITFMNLKKYSYLKFEFTTSNMLVTPKVKDIRFNINHITERLPINKCTMLEFHDISLRIFASGNPEDKTCVFFSEINEPDNFTDSNRLYITREDGNINALTTVGEALLVHCQHSIWKYTGIDEQDWKWKRLPINYGAINKEAVSICNGSIGLYANKNIQIIDYNALTDSAITYPGELMYSLSNDRVNKELLNIKNDKMVRTVYSDNRLYIAYSNEGERNNTILVYDFSSKAFISRYTGINANCFLIKNNGDLYIGSENYILNLSEDFYSDIDKNGMEKPINLHVLTKKFTFGSPAHYKIIWFFKIIVSMFDKYKDSLKVNLKIDYSNKTSFDISLDSDSFSWDKWGEIWGFDDGASLEVFVREKGIRCQVEFIFNEKIGYSKPPYIYGFIFDLEYTDIPLKKIYKKKLLSESYEE